MSETREPASADGLRTLLAGIAAVSERHPPLGAAWSEAIGPHIVAAVEGGVPAELPTVLFLRLALEALRGSGADRPAQAAGRLIGLLADMMTSGEQRAAIAEIEAGHAAADRMLAGLLEQGVDPVLLKALIDRLTLALARAAGSTDIALLFLMITLARLSALPADPPLPEPGRAL